MQRKFGTTVDELNVEDYNKYVELEKLKKTLGSEIDPNHPLAIELDSKLKNKWTEEE